MVKGRHIEQSKKAKYLTPLFCILLLSFFCLPAFSQVTVTKLQDLSFGTFFATTSGTGTVTISNTGARSSSGVVLITSTFNQAIFRLRATKGKKNITAINVGTINLSGSNGGTVSLVFGTPDPAAPFSMNNNTNRDVSIGGVLTVGTVASNPAGSYSGTFTFTVIYN